MLCGCGALPEAHPGYPAGDLWGPGLAAMGELQTSLSVDMQAVERQDYQMQHAAVETTYRFTLAKPTTLELYTCSNGFFRDRRSLALDNPEPGLWLDGQRLVSSPTAQGEPPWLGRLPFLHTPPQVDVLRPRVKAGQHTLLRRENVLPQAVSADSPTLYWSLAYAYAGSPQISVRGPEGYALQWDAAGQVLRVELHKRTAPHATLVPYLLLACCGAVFLAVCGLALSRKWSGVLVGSLAVATLASLLSVGLVVAEARMQVAAAGPQGAWAYHPSLGQLWLACLVPFPLALLPTVFFLARLYGPLPVPPVQPLSLGRVLASVAVPVLGFLVLALMHFSALQAEWQDRWFFREPLERRVVAVRPGNGGYEFQVDGRKSISYTGARPPATMDVAEWPTGHPELARIQACQRTPRPAATRLLPLLTWLYWLPALMLFLNAALDRALRQGPFPWLLGLRLAPEPPHELA